MEHEDDVSPDRISITRCGEILGTEADELSDADVEQIGRYADLTAHVVIEMFLDRHSARE